MGRWLRMFFLPVLTSVESRDPLLDEKLPLVSAAVWRALQATGMSQKMAAHTMGITEAQFSRQLHTTGPNLARLALLPEKFQRAFLPLYAEAVRVQVSALQSSEDRLERLERSVEALLSGHLNTVMKDQR